MKRTMTIKERNTELQNRLVDKSIEAFLMGLEVFNKPTINYIVLRALASLSVMHGN